MTDGQLVAVRGILRDIDDSEDIELVPLADLLHRSLRLNGIPHKSIAKRSESLAILESHLEDLPEAHAYFKSGKTPGFPSALARTLRELRHWSIHEDELFRFEEPRISALGSALAAFHQTQRELNLQTSSDIALQINQLPDRNLSGTPILLLLGDEILPDLLKAFVDLIRFGFELEIVCDVLMPSKAYLETFQKCVGKALPELKSSHWTTHWNNEESVRQAPSVAAFSTSDPVTEVEWVLRKCLEHRRQGVLDHRIALYVSDPETYIPLILSVSSKFLGTELGEAPAIDARLPLPLLANSFASWMLELLESLSALDIRQLPRALRNTYWNLSQDDWGSLRDQSKELLTRGGDSWEHLENWAAEQGDSFVPMRELLAWRRQAIQKGLSLSAWHSELSKLCQLEPIATTANGRGNWRSECDRRALTALLRSLGGHALIAQVQEQAAISMPQFVQLCQRLWKREDVSLPTQRQGLRIVRSSDEIGVVDVLFVLGCHERAFPRKRKENPLLFDEEIALINERLSPSIPLPDSHEEALHERPRFLRICAAPRQFLHFSYARSSGESAGIPSSYLLEMEQSALKLRIQDIPTDACVPLEERCLVEADLLLRHALDAPREPLPPVALTTDKARAVVRPQPEEGFLIRMVAEAAECPFRATARHLLKIKPPAPKSAYYRLRGLLAESGLFGAASEQIARSQLLAETQKIASELALETDEAEVNLLLAAGEDRHARTVTREFRARQIWPRGPEEITTPTKLSELPIHHSVPLRGRDVRFYSTEDGFGQSGPYRVIRMFGSKPDVRQITDLPTQWIEIALKLMLMWRANPPDVAVEIDDGHDERTLMILRKLEDQALPKDLQHGLNIESITDDEFTFKQLFQLLKARLAQTLDRLDTADMKPTPSQSACERCRYGDFCRRSFALNLEQSDDSPFGGDE